MKKLTTIKAWILICSIIVVSNATTGHASSHHNVSHHGDSIPQKRHQNTIIPFGIQIPENVLSTQDVACISADSNIFDMMNKAQETCNGTDMRCTFYHFVKHGLQNIGTLDIDKELFDDLLMKFDNWLLTAENIEEDDVPLDGKTKEGQTETSSISSVYKVAHNTNESEGDIVNTHHIKIPHETHHRHRHSKENNVRPSNIHGKKFRDGNYIKIDPEYNIEHKYFEVFLPKDKETGKPRTIYVEVDKDKNEFILLDKEIEKKLNGTKPIRIELDELSKIADTAFNNIAKSSNNKHDHNSNDDERIKTSDVNTFSEINEDTTNLHKDIEKSTQTIVNPFKCNINANQQLIADNTTGNVKRIVNISKNLVVSNKYINQAQYNVESQIDKTTDEEPNDYLVLLENIKDTDIHQTDLYEETPLDTIDFNKNNTNIGFDLDTIECSLEHLDIPYDDNFTENYEISTEHDNVTFSDDSFKLEENKDTYTDTDFDDTHDFSSSETIHRNKHISQTEKPVQEKKTKSTPNINTEPKLTSSLTAGILNFGSSQQGAITCENRQEHTDLQDHSPERDITLSTYTNIPLLGDLAKVLEKGDHLQSTFPINATLDLPVGVSQNTPTDADLEHPCISIYNSPLDSDFGHEYSRPKTFQSTFSTLPSSPVECVVSDTQGNKGSKYSPLNFGFSWLPSYSRIEDLRLPCAVNSSPQGSIMSLPELKNEPLTDSIFCLEPSSSDHAVTVEESRLFQTVPSLSGDIQEPSLITEPNRLVADTPKLPKHVLTSRLDLPKPNTDFDRIHPIIQLSETPSLVMPKNLKDAVNSPCPMQQIPPYSQPTKPNLLDLGLIKYSPFDNSRETTIPCSANRNRYPYTLIPCFANPYLKPLQFITPYLEPLLPVNPLQSASKIPTFDSLPTSLYQSYPYLNGDCRQETKPLPPLNPLLLVPPGLPYQNLRNKIPYHNIPFTPYTVSPDQSIRNYPPIVNNYLIPSPVLQQNQIPKPLPSKSVPLSVLEQPCPIKNILEMTPSSFAPSSPDYTLPIQMNKNPPSALERDLQSLSLKYGIPLAKILNSLETEISDGYSKSCPPTFELPYSNVVHDSSLINKPILETTNTAPNDEKLSSYECLLESDLSNLLPLDSSLIGPHLEIESSVMLKSINSHGNTVISETIVPPSSYSSFENEPLKVFKDSSLIGPHLSTLTTSNFELNYENLNANDVVLSESDSSYSKPLGSLLIGPHLETGSPRIVIETNNSQGDILISHTEVPIVISSHIEPTLHHQPTNLLLDSSLISLHLPTLSSVKPLLSNEIQNKKDLIPVETDLTTLKSFDSPLIYAREDSVNQLTLHKPSEYLPTNLVEGELQLESDSSRLIPLDSLLIGPDLKTRYSPTIVNTMVDKTEAYISQEIPQNTDNKVEELESIILPPSLLLTLLNKQVKADSNLNSITHNTKLNEEANELSLDTNVEDLPLTDISLIPFKETDFAIREPIPELPSLLDDRNIALPTKDSRTLKHQSKSSDMTHVVHSESLLDHSLTGPSLLKKIEQPDISTSLDSSIILDSSLKGPSILQEKDSLEISLILDSDSSLTPTSINQNQKSSEILKIIDSSIEPESSFKCPTIHDEINSKETSTAFEPVTQFDNSLLPSLHEKKESLATTSVFNSSKFDNSLIGPSLRQETREVSHAFESKDLPDSSLVGSHLLTVPFSSDKVQIINEELQPELDLVNLIPLDLSLVGPHLDFESETSTAFESVTQFDNSLLPSLHETKESLATTSVLNSSQLESSLIGPSLHQETLEVSHAFDYKDLPDSSLVGPHLLTVPFSSDKVQIINEELQPELDLVNLIPLDLSLVGPHLDFESEFGQPEITRYQNPEFSKTPVSNPGVYETTDFVPINLVEGKPPLEPTIVPSLCASDLEELLSKFTNSITKSQLSPSELKPCHKLLSSIAKISSDDTNILLPCKYLQTLTLNTLLNTPLSLQDELASEFSPITMTFPSQEFIPVESITKRLDSNYLPTSKTLVASLPYAQGVPHIPTTPKFIQMKPLTPSFRSVLGNTPVPFFSNAFMPLTPECFKRLSDLASLSKLYPQLSIPYMYTPGDAIAPSSEGTTPSNILSLNEYIPLIPKNNSSVLPSNLESTASNSEYNPIVVDDLMSLLDQNSLQLSKDMSTFPNGQSSLPPTIPVFENGEIVSPSLDTVSILNSDFIQTSPRLPISFTNPLVPSSIYNPQIRLFNPQNVPYKIQTPNISPCNLQPYSNIIPLQSQFSEITESPIAFLQQQLSIPCVESPIFSPSSSLDTMLQLPTASNELNSVPCKPPKEYFTPISSIYTTPSSNAFTNPIIPINASPLSKSIAKPISTPSISLPLNLPYVDSPRTLPPLPIHPYKATTNRPLTPNDSSPHKPIKITAVSDYPYPLTVSHNRPMPSEIPDMPPETYCIPYLHIHASPVSINTSPGSLSIIDKLPPASPISTVLYETQSTPYFSPLPESLTSLGLPAYSDPLTPTLTSPLSPSYLSPDKPTYSYSPLTAPINTQIRPSNLKPANITPISAESSLSSCSKPLPLNPTFNLNPQTTTPEVKLLGQTNSLPIYYANNPFLNAKQRVSISSNILPIHDYPAHVPKPLSSPFSSSHIKQNIPCADALESNLQISSLIEEVPSYVEESIWTYSNDRDDKYYEEPTIKYPLESLSYTLAPEEINETLPVEDFIELEYLTSSAPLNNSAFEPSLQTKLYQRHCLAPYTPLYGKPFVKPHPATQLLQPPSFVETIPQNTHVNTPLVTSSRPQKHPVSLSTSILSNPLLKPLTPFNSTPYFSISSPLSAGQCIHMSTSLSPYNKLPMNEKLLSLSSSPCYFAPSQDMSSPPIDPRELKNIFTPQVTPVFLRVPTNAPFVSVSSLMSLPKSQQTTMPNILDNNVHSPSTHYEPKSKTLTSQGSLVKPSPSPIVSHSNVPYSISPHIPKQALKNIIPSSLYTASDIYFQTPKNKLSPAFNTPRYSSSSPFITETLETVPFYTPSRPFDTTASPSNILKPISPLSSVQHTVPSSSSPYFSQPLLTTDFDQTQQHSYVQHTTKPHPKLSPVSTQYPSLSSAPIYASLPTYTTKPSVPQYSLPSAPEYDSIIHSSPLGKNPYINLHFKPIPSYPVPKNLISSPILTPSESILLSNLKPLDISQEPQNLYASSIISSAPLSSSSLLKPLVKRLPQNSQQYEPQMIPIDSQYVSLFSRKNGPQFLSSTSPLRKSPLQQPLLTNSQYNAPLVPMHLSNTNAAIPEGFPIESVPSVASPDIAFSDYFPSDSNNHKYSSSYDSLSEIPEIVTPINSSSTKPYIFLESPFNKHFNLFSPGTTLINLPLYPNYEILDPSPKLPIEANLINIAKPVEVSANSALESSPLSFDSLEESYELTPDLKERFPALSLGVNQQRQLRPILNHRYLPKPQPSNTRLPSLNRISQISPSEIPSFITPSLLSEEAKLIDTTDFISMSQIKSEPLISNFDDQTSQPGVFQTDKTAPKPNTLSNILEPDILLLSPYIKLLNTEFPPSTYKQLQIYLSPQEYEDLTQDPSPTQTPSSSPTILSSTITHQLTTNPLTGGSSPQIPHYTSPMSITPENWLKTPIFAKYFPEKLIQVPPDKVDIQTLPNKYRPDNKVTPQRSDVISKLDFLKPGNLLHTYKEDLKSNEENNYDPESDNVSLDEKLLNRFVAKPVKSLPEIIKGLSDSNYNNKAQRPQRLSKLDNFYANNHIGKCPQVSNAPTYNISPTNYLTDATSPYTTMTPEILKDFTDIPTKHFGSVPKLVTSSLRPSMYFPDIANPPENVPISNFYPHNYFNPCLKYSSLMKSPLNHIEVADTSEITPDNNVDDIKYSGYKTYQIPSLKFPQTPNNLGTPTRLYSPPVVTYSSPIPDVKNSKVHQNPIHSYFFRPTENSEPSVTQYQTPIKTISSLQTKLGINTIQESPEFNKYNPIEYIPISDDSINEDNELKTSLINYINKREDVTNNLLNNNAELTIPMGNIAITRKEPYNANTIETNNPSIGLKVWKSKVKIAQAELKLKFSDLSVNNFMPIVNNLDKFEMEEIRNIVKNYIDEKYGHHIEINEPYTIDNKYTVIKAFVPNAVDNKYNLLWPTNYV